MRRNAVRIIPLQCPDVAVMLSGYYRNGCPDVAEIRKFRNDSRLLPQTLPAAVRSAPECQALSLNKKTRRSHERNWRENNGGWMGTSFLMSLRESKGCRFSSDSDELVIVR